MACLRLSGLEYKSVKLILECPAVAGSDLDLSFIFIGDGMRAHGISRLLAGQRTVELTHETQHCAILARGKLTGRHLPFRPR